MMLHTKYQGSMPCGLDYITFSLYKPMLNMWPLGRGHFWFLGTNLNELGRGPLGDALHQIAKLKALWFQRRRFFKKFSP